MKKIFLFGAGIVLTVYAAPAGTYEVRKGDSLSKIVKRHFPAADLYGPGGKIAEILSLNPGIRNRHLIFPKQLLILSHPSSVEEIVENPITKPSMELSLPGIDHWNLSLYYGAKYVSLNQYGALGVAKVGVLFLNNISASSDYRNQDWGFRMKFETYNFKFKSVATNGKERLSRLSLNGSYKNFFAGLETEEAPLFRNDSGSIQMSKMAQLSALIGYRGEVKLSSSKDTTIDLTSSLEIPLSSSTEDPRIRLSDVQGFGISVQSILSRVIFDNKDFSIYVNWANSARYRQLMQNVKWETSEGSIKSEFVEISSSLGMTIKF